MLVLNKISEDEPRSYRPGSLEPYMPYARRTGRKSSKEKAYTCGQTREVSEASAKRNCVSEMSLLNAVVCHVVTSLFQQCSELQ